jgi:predicted O-linked N-acetylglucosamine transferase (SPINDLY family)
VAGIAASLLVSAGLTELVAADEDEYIAIACRLAGDRAGLAAMRHSMRDRLGRSALMDGKEFARRMEVAFHDMLRLKADSRRAAV